MSLTDYCRFVAGLPVCLVLFIALPATATDWPQWRGPNRDGVSTETGLLKEWPSNGPPFLWLARGIGSGYSSVSIAGNQIFTMGDSQESSFVHSLSLTNGKVEWSTKVGRPGGDHPGTRCTPSVSGDVVVALGQWGDLVCLKTTDGSTIWRRSMEKDFGGVMMSGWGYSESPLIDGDKVICTPGGTKGTLVAINKTTGELIWQSKDLTDRAAYSSVVPADLGGVHQYIQITDVSVVGVAADDGRVLWKAKRRGSTAVVPTPIVKENYVFVSSGYSVGCNLFKVTGDDKQFNAEQVYANKDLVNHHGGVVRVGNHLYGHSDSRGWVCMDFMTGNVVWENKGVGKGSVVCADGRLITRSEGGRGLVALVEATPDGYKEHGRFPQPERSSKNSWAHPVVCGGKLYLRDQDVLLCYDLKPK
jgi:outer membrane protein assembly factor BamB